MGDLQDPVDILAQELAGIRDGDHRQQAFLRHAAAYGVTRFAYLSTAQPLSPLHVETNYPAEWVDRYRDHGYLAIDPVALEARRTPLPFQWRAALALPAYGATAQRVFDEAATFGIHDGYTIAIHASAGLSMISMAVDDPSLFTPAAARRRQILHLLALHFHMACERALSEPPHEPPPRLTPREREVLLWTAKGKTGWEIAQILKLTERTVTYHVENAKTKLGASSRSQAVVVAMSLGLIQP